MTRRKGELSKSTIDPEWPNQIAIPADQCTGDNYKRHHFFIAGESLSLCPRGHTFYHGARDYHVFCFAEREQAERFQQQFGGELIDPKTVCQ